MGLKAMGEVQRAGKTNAVIGPGCSAACEVTSHFNAGLNILVMAY